MNGIKLQLFLIFSFAYLLLINPHRSFHIKEELIFFFWFECEIKLYIRPFFKNISRIGKKIHLMKILGNDGWFLLLQVNLEIEYLL
jgi:hypothetical protein